MNIHLTKAEFEALPFRDDVKGDYVVGARYRARAHANLVFVFRGSMRSPDWHAFRVTLENE